jgi:hypothetical protein
MRVEYVCWRRVFHWIARGIFFRWFVDDSVQAGEERWSIAAFNFLSASSSPGCHSCSISFTSLWGSIPDYNLEQKGAFLVSRIPRAEGSALPSLAYVAFPLGAYVTKSASEPRCAAHCNASKKLAHLNSLGPDYTTSIVQSYRISASTARYTQATFLPRGADA